MTKVNIGDGGGVVEKTESTSTAASSKPSRPSAKKSTAKTPDAARWLEILQQTLADCQQAGIDVSFQGAERATVVVLRGVYLCNRHESLSLGGSCQQCTSSVPVLAKVAA